MADWPSCGSGPVDLSRYVRVAYVTVGTDPETLGSDIIPSGSIIHNVNIRVDDPYSVGAGMQVGIPSVPTAFMVAGDSNLLVPLPRMGCYERPQASGIFVDEPVLVSLLGTPTDGNSVVFVFYTSGY